MDINLFGIINLHNREGIFQEGLLYLLNFLVFMKQDHKLIHIYWSHLLQSCSFASFTMSKDLNQRHYQNCPHVGFTPIMPSPKGHPCKTM
jgi:hypothetical protein